MKVDGRWWNCWTKVGWLNQGVAVMVTDDFDTELGTWTPVRWTGHLPTTLVPLRHSTTHPVIVVMARRMHDLKKYADNLPIPTMKEAEAELLNPPKGWDPVELS